MRTRITALAAPIAAAAMLTTAAAVPAAADQDGAAGECVANARLVRTLVDVNVRTGAGTQHSKLGAVPAGHWRTMTDAANSNDSWYQIQWHGGRTAYVARLDPATGRALSEGPWIGDKPCNGPRPVIEPIPAAKLVELAKLGL